MRRLLAFGRRRFVRDTLLAQGAGYVQAATYLATSVLVARFLGPTETGRWSAALEISLLVTFVFSAGLTTAAQSRYAEACGRAAGSRSGDDGADDGADDRPADRVAGAAGAGGAGPGHGPDDARRIEVLAGVLKLGTLLALGILAVVALFAPDFAAGRYDDRAVGVAAGWLALTALLEVGRTLAVTALMGAGRWAAFARFDVLANVLRVGLVAVAALAVGTVEALVVAALLHAAVALGLALAAYRQARRLGGILAPPPLRAVLAAVPRASIGRFFGLTWMLAVNKTVHRAVTRLGVVVIPALGPLLVTGDGMAEGAAFKVAFVLNLVLQNAVGAISSVFLTTLGNRLGDAPLVEQGPLLRRVSLAAGGLTALATVVSVPLAWLAIRHVYGAGFEGAFDHFVWLAVGNLFLGFGVVVGPFYIYADRLRVSVAVNVTNAALVVAGMAWAVPRFGAVGIAAAVGLGHALLLVHLLYAAWWFRRARAAVTAAR